MQVLKDSNETIQQKQKTKIKPNYSLDFATDIIFQWLEDPGSTYFQSFHYNKYIKKNLRKNLSTNTLLVLCLKLGIHTPLALTLTEKRL